MINQLKVVIKYPQVPEETQKLRKFYIDTFINVDKEYYKKNIDIRHNYSDGLCYTGYLLDCLKVISIIDIESIKETVSMFNEVIVFGMFIRKNTETRTVMVLIFMSLVEHKQQIWNTTQMD